MKRLGLWALVNVPSLMIIGAALVFHHRVVAEWDVVTQRVTEAQADTFVDTEPLRCDRRLLVSQEAGLRFFGSSRAAGLYRPPAGETVMPTWIPPSMLEPTERPTLLDDVHLFVVRPFSEWRETWEYPGFATFDRAVYDFFLSVIVSEAQMQVVVRRYATGEVVPEVFDAEARPLDAQAWVAALTALDMN